MKRVGDVLRRYPIWIAVLLLYLVTAAFSPAMLRPEQMANVLQVTAFLGVMATGQTLALLIGGIDLSVAGMVTLTNIVATSVMRGEDAAIAPALAVCLGLSVLVGLLNGALVAFGRVAPIIATLAMNSILFGAALVYTDGAPFGSTAPSFNAIAQGSILGIPASALWWLATAAVAALFLRRTTFGRWIYAVGASPVAAGMMGVPVRAVVVVTYMLSAVLAMCGGLLVTAYIGNPSLGIGSPYMLTSIVAVVVGGTALTGGVGSVVATVAGALFVTALTSLTNIAQVSSGMQFVIQGALIAASVVAYRAFDPSRATA